MGGPILSSRVARLADEARDHVASDSLRKQIEVVRGDLDRPLRVAVAGREKSGKSTLVNAILGQRIAPTDAGVCTKVVTWYEFGEEERAELLTYEGKRTPVALRRDDDGAATISLEADPKTIERITIRIPNPDLESLTIIDTPGLASLQELDTGARELLFMHAASRTAGEQADGLIFLMSPTVMDDDRQALTDFSERFGGLRASAGNAIGVLSRADQLGDGSGDPWPTADRMAARQARALATVVSSVTPVVGLLAESMPYLNERDVDHIEALAQIDPTDRELMLIDGSIFLSWETAVPVESRRRLLRMLGQYGIREALAAVDAGVSGAVAMAAHLDARSGMQRIRELVLSTFGARNDVLRANSALTTLTRLANAPDGDDPWLPDLRREIERLLFTPEMHRLEEVSAGELIARRSIALPDDLREDVRLLLAGDGPTERLGLPLDSPRSEQLAVAERRWRRWRAFANDPLTTADGRRVADVFERSHAFLLDAPEPTPVRK